MSELTAKDREYAVLWMKKNKKEPRRMYSSALGNYAWHTGSTFEWELPGYITHWMRSFFPDYDAAVGALAYVLRDLREVLGVEEKDDQVLDARHEFYQCYADQLAQEDVAIRSQDTLWSK